jgi:RNA polymerase sigma-70 factor (ECF subfamily)
MEDRVCPRNGVDQVGEVTGLDTTGRLLAAFDPTRNVSPSAGIIRMSATRAPMHSPPAAAKSTLSLDQILRRVRAGDPDGIAELYDRHAEALYRTAYRVSGSRHDAEDIVHDLFVGLPEALKRYEERGNLQAWLTRIVVRLALMRARANSRRRTASIAEAEHVASAGRTDARLDRSEVNAAVMALPASLRLVFTLRQVEGFSHDEVAGMLGISTGASRVRLARAIRLLRRSLG